MLVNFEHVPLSVRVPGLRAGLIEEEEDKYDLLFFPPRVQTGVYMTDNLHLVLDGISVPWDPAKAQRVRPYGVADTLEQILDLFAEEECDPVRQFVLEVRFISKYNQYPQGGWRWHKWGPYIGTNSPSREFLYDEPEIEHVYCFCLHEVRLP